MSKYFHVLIVLLIVLLVAVCVFLLFKFWGVYIPYWVGWSVLVSWMLLCGLSFYIGPAVYFFWHRLIRRTSLAEDAILFASFSKVAEKAGVHGRSFCFWIEETSELNAFAIGRRTIVVSKGLLGGISGEELEAVLAHELGHLLNGDVVLRSAVAMAGGVPRMVWVVCVFCAQWVGKLLGLLRLLHLRWVGIGVVLVVMAVFVGLGVFMTYLSLLGVFLVLHFVLSALQPLLERLAVYRQDSWVYRLGYGRSLCAFLEKLTGGDHRVRYNRIRHLEKLEGLR